ncbi:MAG: stage III sporulation protein AB [Clostridia bacterium]|jgi:stage III sporulation protein AB|nr:stage III sporulation protein AB [Clostridia bacterium]MDD3862294.1 stage III sporulation protein AB [Clostridia bacterium]
MKYLILILIVIICGYIGFGLSSYYSNRLKFFKNLELLFEKLCLEINYSQHKLVSIMQDFSTKNKDVMKLISNYVVCLNDNEKLTVEALFREIKILNSEEKNILNLFFMSLGKLDVSNQIKQLENQKEQIKRYYQKADEEAKKYVPLYMKLGIIFGLLLALIFM